MPEVKAYDLDRHLRQGLAPLYLISGDEPLLAQECMDTIRKAARAAGCEERSVHHAEGNFAWGNLIEDLSGVSMFASKRLIELHYLKGNLEKNAADAICGCLPSLSEDNTLLVRMMRLSAPRNRRPAWYKKLTINGVHVEVWPVEIRDMPNWLNRRLRASGIRMTAAASRLLSEMTEGNLLMAVQEIEKLQILDQGQTWDSEALLQVSADSSRYSAYNLIDEALTGNLRHALKILYGLQQEREPPMRILYSLHKELLALHEMVEAVESGARPQDAVKARRIIWKRAKLVERAITHLSRTRVEELLARLAWTEQAVMGLTLPDVWTMLRELLIGMSCPQAGTLLHSARMVDMDRTIRPLFLDG